MRLRIYRIDPTDCGEGFLLVRGLLCLWTCWLVAALVLTRKRLSFYNYFYLYKLSSFKGCSAEKKGGTNGALFVPGGQ
jgi:hypothetical protein